MRTPKIFNLLYNNPNDSFFLYVNFIMQKEDQKHHGGKPFS